jgi:DNA-binding XRE family transcriptional regulator
MSDTEVITQQHWHRTARRVERETIARYGSSLTATSISHNAGHMIIESGDGGPDGVLLVERGWAKVMRQVARKYIIHPDRPAKTPRVPRQKFPPMPPGHPGERVTLLRRRKGWSQQELARAAGVAQRTVSLVEQGQNVQHATLVALAAALETTVSELTKPIV